MLRVELRPCPGNVVLATTIAELLAVEDSCWVEFQGLEFRRADETLGGLTMFGFATCVKKS